MSSASTIGLPFLKSDFVAPAFTSGVGFNFIIENDSSIPVGNYLVWTYLYIKGDTDTDLGPIVIILDNGLLYPATLNSAGTIINDGAITFQTSQIISITTEQPNIILKSSITFSNNEPTVSGTIYFLPI